MSEKLDELLKEKGDKLRPIIEAELARRSLFEFLKMSAPILYPHVQFEWNWHFEYICNELQAKTEAMLRGEEKDKDLIIGMPFRSGKSILINIIFPVFLWIKEPSLSIISVSASEALATRFSHQSKILIESEWFEKRWGNDIKLRPDSKSKLDFLNTKGGRRSAFGINSTVIGTGCSVMILDDVNTPDETSALALNSVLQTYQDTLYSRLDNPSTGFRVVLQQRIAEADLTGELLRTNPNGYKHVCIPARLTEHISPPELIKYYDHNGLFWPNRFSDKVLKNFEKTLRPSAYASQLMQRPAPEQGNIIKRDFFTIEPIKFLIDKKIQWKVLIDTAFTKNTQNDPSSIMLAGKYDNNIIIRKVWTVWKEMNDLLTFIKEKGEIYGVHSIHIETQTSGILIYQELKRNTNIPILELKPGSKDKLSRVQSILPQLESKRCILIEDPEWNTDFINECISFPYGKHDDSVDTLFYAMNLIKSGGITKFV